MSEKTHLPLGMTDNYPLACPKCGGVGLHHIRAEVYQRTQPGSEDGVQAIVERREHSLLSSVGTQMGNPSEKHDGIAVFFVCEHCISGEGDARQHDVFVLHLTQQSGKTHINWKADDNQTN